MWERKLEVSQFPFNNNGLNEFGEVQTPQPISENDEEVIPMEEVKTFEIKLNL